MKKACLRAGGWEGASRTHQHYERTKPNRERRAKDRGGPTRATVTTTVRTTTETTTRTRESREATRGSESEEMEDIRNDKKRRGDSAETFPTPSPFGRPPPSSPSSSAPTPVVVINASSRIIYGCSPLRAGDRPHPPSTQGDVAILHTHHTPRRHPRTLIPGHLIGIRQELMLRSRSYCDRRSSHLM